MVWTCLRRLKKHKRPATIAKRTTPPTTPPTIAPTFVLVEVEPTLTEVVDGVEVDEVVVVKFSTANTFASPVEKKVASRSLSI